MTDTASVDHRLYNKPHEPRMMHSHSDKMRALSIYAECLSASTASEVTGIPRSTITTWLDDEESNSYIDTLRQALRANVAHQYVKATMLAVDAIIDRLENGDEQVIQGGEVIRVKVKARDAAAIAGICTDRHALLTGMSQGSKAGAALAQVAANLIAALNSKQGKLVEHEPEVGQVDRSSDSAEG